MEEEPRCYGKYVYSMCEAVKIKCDHKVQCARDAELANNTLWEPKEKSKEAPKRDSEEAKPDMSYLPMDLLEEVARAYEFGGKKGYPRESWREGFSISRLVAASRRHDADFWNKGETFDKQAKEEYGMEVYHSAMVIFNQLCILDALINHPELDNRKIKPKE